MNRFEFIGQTHQGKLVSIDEVIQYFDHAMAAYGLVGNVDDIHVSGNTDNIHSSLNLKIESPNPAKLQEVVAYINDTIHNHTNLYGKTFQIGAAISGNSIDLFVREEYQPDKTPINYIL